MKAKLFKILCALILVAMVATSLVAPVSANVSGVVVTLPSTGTSNNICI